MRRLVFAAVVLAGLAVGCDTSDDGNGLPCGGGTCGYLDDHYNSTFYCPPAPFIPGGWYGYTWHDPAHCHEECATAASWGCDASGCEASCDTDTDTDTGSGAWLPCTEANGGQVTPDGCSLSGSGVHGETVPCVCR